MAKYWAKILAVWSHWCSVLQVQFSAATFSSLNWPTGWTQPLWSKIHSFKLQTPNGRISRKLKLRQVTRPISFLISGTRQARFLLQPPASAVWGALSDPLSRWAKLSRSTAQAKRFPMAQNDTCYARPNTKVHWIYQSWSSLPGKRSYRLEG